ncbi:hypothetical protein SERLA73DRAFT_155611 [Serpula lacrymans var. lacrymans S7.3]|uniref:Uncharacterized protein n=1 Tax=Serpula lacrymans var. lacrymans (strain S7.3) TaxID=936435 RepID=F8QBP1_SERL3|nr:hypothetical protein SERLA73DRAFT_155611 [Serpula lacrymans var. lacrymans S7.3]
MPKHGKYRMEKQRGAAETSSTTAVGVAKTGAATSARTGETINVEQRTAALYTTINEWRLTEMETKKHWDLDEPLDLQLFRDDDDDGDLFYKRRLHALINGNRLDPRTLTPGEEEKGIVSMRAITLTPSPSGNIEMVFSTIARLCSTFPLHHPGQDRIIHFLEALRAMWEQQVPNGVPAEDHNDHFETQTTIL